MVEEKSIEFGSSTIEFQLTRAERKTMGVKVYPDRSVHVVAPMDSPESKIFEKVRAKAPWIKKQQGFFLSFQPLTPPRKYISGETHLYLGRQYRLQIFENEKKEVKLKGRFLEVHSPGSEKSAIQKQVEDWYREKGLRHFSEIITQLLPRFKEYNLPEHHLVIRKMEKRWGSCAPSGRITLNLELIKAPKGSIEYVIVHELCHLMHPDHTHRFYDLQEKIMPDWRKWKEKLERTLA